MTVFRHRNIAIQLAILLAFVVRSFIPLGFMPGKTAANDGQLFPMVICSAGGTSTVYLTADKIPAAPAQAPHDETAQHDHTPCVFSASFHLAVGALPAAALPLPVTLAAAKAISADVTQLPTFEASAAYFAQGPPVFLQA
ncbi:MAG: hypothetical protein PW788_01465 [Micavibrio sp.]|nr:hypothetical protein [Micavibrio sp.]